MTTGCASLGRPAKKRLVNNGCQSAFRPIFRGPVRSKIRAGSLIDSELHTKGGTVMGKSANGPDILDCGPMMEAIGNLHGVDVRDRKSTRLNSSHSQISYAVFCLKKKKEEHRQENT